MNQKVQRIAAADAKLLIKTDALSGLEASFKLQTDCISVHDDAGHVVIEHRGC
jgi:hypothetical protein